MISDQTVLGILVFVALFLIVGGLAIYGGWHFPTDNK